MDACGKTAGWIELLIGTVVGLFFVNAKLCRSGGVETPQIGAIVDKSSI